MCVVFTVWKSTAGTQPGLVAFADWRLQLLIPRTSVSDLRGQAVGEQTQARSRKRSLDCTFVNRRHSVYVALLTPASILILVVSQVHKRLFHHLSSKSQEDDAMTQLCMITVAALVLTACSSQEVKQSTVDIEQRRQIQQENEAKEALVATRAGGTSTSSRRSALTRRGDTARCKDRSANGPGN